LISIGKIGKPIGVKGEVRVLPLTSNILRYKEIREVYLPEKREVEYFKILGKKIILKVRGIDSYNDAYLYLKGREIKIPESKRIKKEEDEYFYDELIGSSLISVNGEFIGRVIGVMEAGNEILVSEINGEEVLIPFVKEYCKQVNVKDKKIIVEIPEELLTLNSEK